MQRVWRILRGVFMALLVILCAALLFVLVIMGDGGSHDEANVSGKHVMHSAQPYAMASSRAWDISV